VTARVSMPSQAVEEGPIDLLRPDPANHQPLGKEKLPLPPGTQSPGMGPGPRHADPLILALARYVEALDRRYPDGPDQMRREALDGRGNMPRMRKSTKIWAA
jgi:hypothetical protein